MTIVFLSNFINHHQVPVADELYQLTDHNYRFIATEPIPESFLRSGYPDFSDKPYLIKAYESVEKRQEADADIRNADVVICGSAPESWIQQRIKDNKLTFRYSERWFKTKPWFCTGLRGWFNIYFNHIRYCRKPLYMLAASAYTANDVYNVGVYRNKVYKWGYFTKVEDFDFETSFASKQGSMRIMWCARFLVWKHPELPVRLAKRLKDDGYSFELDMFGSGPELEKTRDLASALGVSDVVSFCGNMPNDELLQEMRQHDIFLFTSDRNEGWGAVLNESMSSGCAVVASDKIGAVPFLVHDHENGMIFQSEVLQSLYNAVKTLMDDKNLRKKISHNAYESMHHLWNPRNAAESFIRLSSSLLNNESCTIDIGPCSKAYPVKQQ